MLLLFAFTPGLDPIGHDAESEPWDATKPRGRTRKIDFSTDDGPRMSVDVSPDGRWLVFDPLAQSITTRSIVRIDNGPI